MVPLLPSPLKTNTHPGSMMVAEGSSTAAAPTAAGEGGKALHELYPANAFMELTLSAESGGEKVSGIVHCTDEISNTVVLRSSLVYTTLSSQIRFVGAATVAERKVLRESGEDGGEAAAEGEAGPTAADLEEMARPLPPPPTKKALEDREKRALKMAMEHMKHINDSATPLGQATFDTLLKACNSVEWVDGTAIVVLGEVRVDEPYGPEDCVLIRPGKTERERNLAMDSLNRVKKIIAHKG